MTTRTGPQNTVPAGLDHLERRTIAIKKNDVEVGVIDVIAAHIAPDPAGRVHNAGIQFSACTDERHAVPIHG